MKKTRYGSVHPNPVRTARPQDINRAGVRAGVRVEKSR